MLDDITIENDKEPNTRVKASFTEGYGLFAERNLEAGEVVINGSLFPLKSLYINHSRKPNCVRQEDGILMACAQITRGDELFLDYRPEMTEDQHTSWI